MEADMDCVVQGLSQRACYSKEYIASLHGNPMWEAIWSVIKSWDISRHPGALYHGPTGDDATEIFEAVTKAIALKNSASA